MLAQKNHPNLLHIDNTLLVVIDVQEPFLRNVCEAEQVVRNVRMLMQGANALRVPIIATTQYAEKMGDLVPEIKRLLPPLMPPFDKLSFSCCESPACASEIQRSGRKQVLLCGVETHICVSQTAHDLLGAGFQVHVAADAVSSRTEANRRIGLEKMRQSGILMSSVEMALFELLHEAGTPEFKEVHRIIK